MTLMRMKKRFPAAPRIVMMSADIAARTKRIRIGQAAA